jgi:hypothetical protein
MSSNEVCRLLIRFKQNNTTTKHKNKNQGRDWRPAAGCNGNLGGRASDQQRAYLL